MAEKYIVRGTTPIIRINFNQINYTAIEKAILVVKQDGTIKIEKDLTQASGTGFNYIEWTLTQNDTLSLYKDISCVIVCDWLTSTGARGRSKAISLYTKEPGKNEVMN